MSTQSPKSPNYKATLVIVTFYLTYFCKMVFGFSVVISSLASITLAIIGLITLFYLIAIKRINLLNNGLLLLVTTLWFIGIVSSFCTGNYRLYDYVVPLQYLGVGLLLIEYRLVSRIMYASFFFYTGYFLVNMVIGSNVDNIFYGFSRNNISILMIMHTALLYISVYQNKLSIPFYPAILTLVFSFWGRGRSGIVASILLLVLVLFYQFLLSKKRGLRILQAYFCVMLVVVIIAVFGSQFSWVLNFRFQDPHRALIIDEYLYNSGATVRNFLMGVSIEDNPIFAHYGYNLHNSYLRVHAYYGLFGILLVYLLILSIFFKSIKTNNFLFLGLAVVMLLRMSTDIPAFNGPYDPILYYLGFFKLKDINNSQQLIVKAL